MPGRGARGTSGQSVVPPEEADENSMVLVDVVEEVGEIPTEFAVDGPTTGLLNPETLLEAVAAHNKSAEAPLLRTMVQEPMSTKPTVFLGESGDENKETRD